MSEAKCYKLKKKLMDDTFAVPRKLISRLSEAGSCELKIFLIMASMDAEDGITESELISELERAGVSTCDIAEGLAFLRGAGLIEKGTAKKQAVPVSDGTEVQAKTAKAETAVKEAPQESVFTPSAKPSYTSKQLAEAAKSREFKELLDWASKRLGRTLNTSDVSTLYSFHDYLCLPYDVVMLGIEHCVSEGKASLRYIEKLLIDFADKDINTYEKAESYIIRRAEFLSFEGKIRTLMGLGQRTLTTKERAMLSQWKDWQMSDEMIKLAYEKTVEKTGKASMSYMHKILESWHTSGFTTVSQVERGDVKPSNSSFDVDDFFRVAVESSRRKSDN